MTIRVLISLIFIVSLNVSAIDKIDRIMFDEAINWIEKYTKEKDFLKATKYYFEGTKFYAHEIVDGKEIITESSLPEILPMIKEYFETSDLEVIEEKEINKKISFSSNNQIATGIFESVNILSSNGKQYQSHGITTFVFGIKNGSLVLLESHDENISFNQL